MKNEQAQKITSPDAGEVTFRNHLANASSVVEKWPGWKQNILGGVSDSRTALHGAKTELNSAEHCSKQAG